MAQVELVNGIAADRSKSGNLVAAGVRHRVGHHAAIGESAAVDALAVNLILRGNILDDRLQKLHVKVILARGIPARNVAIEDREVYVFSLRISHDIVRLVGHNFSERAIVCTMTIGTVERYHKRAVSQILVRNIKLVISRLAADCNLNILVYCLFYFAESKVGGSFICCSLGWIVEISVFSNILYIPTTCNGIIFYVPDGCICTIKSSLASTKV